jgi:dihydroneopterin aldolase
LNSLKKYNNISKATVTIHKPNSPLKELVEDISVTASEEF